MGELRTGCHRCLLLVPFYNDTALHHTTKRTDKGSLLTMGKPSSLSAGGVEAPLPPPVLSQSSPIASPLKPACSSSLRLQNEVEQWMGKLEAELTTDYYRALEVIPEIVRKESRVSDFLRMTKNNAQQAAIRLALYWKTRKELFGERWLLPMTQSGSGALNQQDIVTLRSGFCKVVQSSTHGLVFINDFSLLPKGSTQVQAKIAFYLATICAQETAVTSLFVVRSRERPFLKASNEMKAIKECSANFIKNIFVARAYEEGREHLLDYLGYQQARMTQVNYNQAPQGYIASNSLAGTYNALQERGFDKDCLPRELGGDVDISVFDNWVRMRLSLEDVMGSAPILRKRGAIAATSALALASNIDASALTKKVKRGKEYPTLTRKVGETEKEFAKRKNACYVRRNYHRQKLEIMAVQGEATKCLELNELLKIENERLNLLVREAMEVVDNYRRSSATVEDEEESKGTAPTASPAPTVSSDVDEAEEDITECDGGGDDDDDSISYASILLEAQDCDIDAANLDDVDY